MWWICCYVWLWLSNLSSVSGAHGWGWESGFRTFLGQPKRSWHAFGARECHTRAYRHISIIKYSWCFFFQCLCSFEAKFDSWSSKCWFGPLVCQLHSRRLGKPTVARNKDWYKQMIRCFVEVSMLTWPWTTLVLSTFCQWHSFAGCWMHDSPSIITHSFLVWAGESAVQTTVLGFTTKDFTARTFPRGSAHDDSPWRSLVMHS